MKQTIREFFKENRIHTARIALPVPHVHDDIELLYVIKGGCTAVNDGQKYTLKQNDFFFSFPNQLHYYPSYEENSLFLLCIIKPYTLLQYESLFLGNLPVNAAATLPDNEITRISTISDWIREEITNSDSDIIISYITLFFGKLLKYIELKTRTTSSDSISNVIHYCAENYREDISIHTIAKALHLSESYVSFIFNKYLLISFNDYINSLRISDAVSMLKYGEYSMSYISDTVGFSTIRTFNRAFQKEYNMTPTEFKKHYKTQSEKSNK